MVTGEKADKQNIEFFIGWGMWEWNLAKIRVLGLSLALLVPEGCALGYQGTYMI